MKHVFVAVVLTSLLAVYPQIGLSEEILEQNAPKMSLVFRDIPIAELFELLSRKERVSIIVSRGVTGNVSVNLYDVTVQQAIRTVAESSGYSVEERGGSFFVTEKKEKAVRIAPEKLVIRPMTVQYSNPRTVADMLAKHVSPGGRVTLLEERKTLIVEDTDDNIARLERLLQTVDTQPAQILIEAKILEITLDNTQQFGVDWSRIFSAGEMRQQTGTRGLARRDGPGFFYELVNRNVEVYLNALSDKGRVHTLATPKLLTLENQEATTKIGDQIGYKVTTTIQNVTTESIQFLDTGVILRVMPSIDAKGRIAMKIRPEVSSGIVTGGIPSKKTTEVTTQLVAEDGQSILIGGLIKNSQSNRRTGVPILSDIPAVGVLFSSTESIGVSTETVVIITPKVVRTAMTQELRPAQEEIEKLEEDHIHRKAETRFGGLGLTLDLGLGKEPRSKEVAEN